MRRRLSRRKLIGTVAGAAASVGLAPLAAAARRRAAAATKPNIIFILADDLGYGDLGCFGQKMLATPHVDRMAAEGVRFTRHYAGSTVCAPSRCVLLTGLHTGHARIRGNSPGLLTDEDVTVAEVLKGAGYATGCVGKWGVGNPPPLDDPARRGFDEFYGYISMWHAHNCYPEFIIRNGRREALRNEVAPRWKKTDGRGVATKKLDYVPDLITAEALRFIERHKDRPFFLYWSLNTPHANNEAGKGGMEVPDLGEFADKDWPAPEKGFAAMIRNMDRDVGRLLARLKRLGLDEKTLVIFTSDNGPHQEGGHREAFFDSNGPLRGMKRDLYEGGLRVPTIARWPGRTPAGRTSDHISGFQDYFATFAELAGAKAPTTDGISMAPTLLGRPGEQKKHAHLYWEFLERGGKRAVLKGNWKAVRQNVRKKPDGPVELYDLSKDLGERNDVAADHPRLVAELAAIMAAEHVDLK